MEPKENEVKLTFCFKGQNVHSLSLKALNATCDLLKYVIDNLCNDSKLQGLKYEIRIGDCKRGSYSLDIILQFSFSIDVAQVALSVIILTGFRKLRQWMGSTKSDGQFEQSTNEIWGNGDKQRNEVRKCKKVVRKVVESYESETIEEWSVCSDTEDNKKEPYELQEFKKFGIELIQLDAKLECRKVSQNKHNT
jgi:hypothetical protein